MQWITVIIRLIEETLHRNLELLCEADSDFQSTQKNSQTDQGKTTYVNKYGYGGGLYESAIVDRVPKFICVSPQSKGR